VILQERISLEIRKHEDSLGRPTHWFQGIMKTRLRNIPFPKTKHSSSLYSLHYKVEIRILIFKIYMELHQPKLMLSPMRRESPNEKAVPWPSTIIWTNLATETYFLLAEVFHLSIGMTNKLAKRANAFINYPNHHLCSETLNWKRRTLD
jgi:hypothetical protein